MKFKGYKSFAFCVVQDTGELSTKVLMFENDIGPQTEDRATALIEFSKEKKVYFMRMMRSMMFSEIVLAEAADLIKKLNKDYKKSKKKKS